VKKIAVWLTALVLLWTPLLSTAEAAREAGGAGIVIAEGSFLYQINHMEADPAAFAGQTVEIEGLFGAFHYGTGDELQTYYRVYRYIPGSCCGGYVTGLEVYWPDPAPVYPADDTWVRAQGVLETYELDGVTYLQARLTQLEQTDGDAGERLATR